MHIETKHEVRKRLRGDTSLIEGRCDCGDVSEQNNSLRNELQTEKDRIEEIKKSLK